jgi:hypothetical protein
VDVLRKHFNVSSSDGVHDHGLVWSYHIPNFVIHPDTGSEQRTDVDLLGVRFPYRSELLLNSMRDDEMFRRVREKAYVVFLRIDTLMAESV